MSEWKKRVENDMMRTFGPTQALLVRGEGCWVEDEDGTRYLDFLAGIAVNALGHAHPVMVEAISRQAATLIHVSNYFSTPPQLELAERLKRLTGAGDEGRAYFGNSGAEANEAAFKLARLNKGEHGTKWKILSLENSFHGRTMGSLALTGKPALHAGFEPLPGGVEYIESTVEALENAIDDSVAALIVEPIKGEAGVIELPDGFLEAARRLTAEHGALLIIDEIQTGAGRTGSWFAYQRAGIVPDAVTLAKGIGGGFPIGALVTFGRASQLFSPGQHGSTFGGNPLATATANAVLGEIERAGLVENARVRGEQLRALIEGVGSPLIIETRGAGLLVGVGLAEPVAPAIVRAALAAGLIINAPNDRSLRIAPPLIVGDAELAEFDTRFRAALAAI
ncbi:acetylornithine aminotransferase [Labedella gwakjiensis]|uniref:Acetylornithine aminotransferase n=1 Tax=Labedella gwakjiensis TaxID=390269 RepID=A0A2P8GYQ4_9MICO|nr:acetylornithine transaminase [Labedella gwakjiensis]PSL39085.1 acetylornithine aminotransferase [Labedella gwakjiensis]RUQ86468.1 acetylornithine transaminase [Labedella gwakjiensis]